MDIQALKNIYTEAELDTVIATWKAALAAVASGQEFVVHGDTYKEVDAPQIRKTIEWYAQIKTAYSTEVSAKTAPQINIARPGR